MKYASLALIAATIIVISIAPSKTTLSSGVTLPVVWGTISTQLVETGVIDTEKMTVLNQDPEKNIVITKENAGYLLNLFWAFGLANKNPILEDKTEMMNPAYGGAGHFASTGGWTLAKGDAMEHYNMHTLVALTAKQQKLVDKVSRTVYRPCCGNSTHFPDCNHGMAMLGLLEMMASQGVSERDMYDTARVVNSYWFPDTPAVESGVFCF